MSGFIMDAGALIALERRSKHMLDLLDAAVQGKTQVTIPRTVIAQVWRGTSKQANVARLVNLSLHGRGTVIIDELTPKRAREIGVKIGAVHHPDIVDVHVALVAAERGHAVLTSDDADIAKVNPNLVLIHV